MSASQFRKFLACLHESQGNAVVAVPLWMSTDAWGTCAMSADIGAR